LVSTRKPKETPEGEVQVEHTLFTFCRVPKFFHRHNRHSNPFRNIRDTIGEAVPKVGFILFVVPVVIKVIADTSSQRFNDPEARPPRENIRADRHAVRVEVLMDRGGIERFTFIPADRKDENGVSEGAATAEGSLVVQLVVFGLVVAPITEGVSFDGFRGFPAFGRSGELPLFGEGVLAVIQGYFGEGLFVIENLFAF
jgi:hypothetical protein